MDEALGIVVLVAAVAAVVGLAFYWAWKYERNRTEAFRGVAEELGFAFSAEPSGTADRFGGLRIFSQGHSKRVRNQLSGAGESAEVSLFDYSYTVGSGKNKTKHSQTVVCLESPELELPQFELRPEHFFHRIGGVFGYQDIDFGDFPEFSRKYLLRGPDEPAIRSVFDAAVVSHVEGLDRVCLEGGGRQLVFYRHAKRVRAEELRPLLEEAFGVFAVLRGSRESLESRRVIARS